MARVYSHRRSNSQKKAKPIEAMHAAAVSVVSVVMFLALILFSASKAGETTKWIGGIGMLGFCTAIGAFAYNIGQMKDATDLKSRVICMSISSFALVLWVVTAIIGMFN